jgi:GMP synthase-like glutamine amidotransferase
VRVLSIVHQRDAGAGVFGEEAAARGHELVEWVPPESSVPPDGFDAAMVFGGAMNVDEEERHPWLAGEKRLLGELVKAGTPTLGVCLGAELLAEAAGASVRRAPEPEIGWRDVELTAEARDDPLLGALPRRFRGFQWHSYEFAPVAGGLALARSPICLQAFRVEPLLWGIQFHAEVTRESVGQWIDDYRNDADAVRIGVDPDALRAETDDRIDAWNELGRDLCGRFLVTAEASSTPA